MGVPREWLALPPGVLSKSQPAWQHRSNWGRYRGVSVDLRLRL